MKLFNAKVVDKLYFIKLICSAKGLLNDEKVRSKLQPQREYFQTTYVTKYYYIKHTVNSQNSTMKKSNSKWAKA